MNVIMQKDEKERLKESYLKCMKKTFESLTTKTTKKNFERRNRRDKQNFLLRKSDLIPFCF